MLFIYLFIYLFIFSVLTFRDKMTDKVSIYYTSDGQLWADYLKDKLNSKEYSVPVDVINLCDGNFDFSSKVNVFLVSPDFLYLKNWHVLKNFDTKTAVAVLAGVDQSDWTQAASLYNVESVLEWLDYELEASDTSVRNLLMFIIGIYESSNDPDWDDYMNIPATQNRAAPQNSEYKVPPSRPSRQPNSVTNVFRKVIHVISSHKDVLRTNCLQPTSHFLVVLVMCVCLFICFSITFVHLLFKSYMHLSNMPERNSKTNINVQ